MSRFYGSLSKRIGRTTGRCWR